MNNKKFIWILLRGGMDGLSLLPPYGLDEYYSLRPHIAIPKEKLIKINDKFGMYPSLKNGLFQLFQNNQLLIYPQSGQFHNSKNHYKAQKQMEIGSSDQNVKSGFLNRMAQYVANAIPVCFSPELPQVFRGDLIVNNISIERYITNINLSNQHKLFEQFKNTSFKEHFKKILQHKKIMESIQEDYLNFESKNLGEKIGIYIKESNSNIAFIDTGHNWDTHSLFNPGVIHGNESHNFDKHSIDVSSDGRLYFLFNMLDETIMSLKKGLAEDWNNTVIAINTEFGRSNYENGSQGLDHGYGSMMLVTGGLVKQSNIIGDIQSLKEEDSFEGKYLNVTQEYREILSLIFKEYLELNEQQIKSIFI